jgi:hypothetical protein
MHPNLTHAIGTAPRRTSLSRLLLAVLCMVGLCASLLQPVSARGVSKAQTAVQTAFLKNHAVKGGKPCQRMVPGAVASCIAGAMVGLEATSSVVFGPLHTEAGLASFTDMTLQVQWIGVPQFRPPRICA